MVNLHKRPDSLVRVTVGGVGTHCGLNGCLDLPYPVYGATGVQKEYRCHYRYTALDGAVETLAHV